ncbi:hypothetical protein DFH27DRAFT_615372 [Peziza echinospora]|nr:hypothetical protein DFH27DRAFT_615372 [Peziza echinospora]
MVDWMPDNSSSPGVRISWGLRQTGGHAKTMLLMTERLHNSDHFLVVTPAFSAPSPDKTQKNPIRSWDSYKLDLQSPSSSQTPLPTLPVSGSPESPIIEVHNLITHDLLFFPQSTPSPLDTPAATQVLSSPVLSKVTPAPTPTPIPMMDASNALMMMSLGSMMKQDHFSGDGKVSVEEFESQLNMCDDQVPVDRNQGRVL